jgi:hypothetical protein
VRLKRRSRTRRDTQKKKASERRPSLSIPSKGYEKFLLRGSSMVGITFGDWRALASAKRREVAGRKRWQRGPTAGPSCPISGHVVAGITMLAN